MQKTLRGLRSLAASRGPIVVLSVKPLADRWLVREAEASTGEVYDRRRDAIARAGLLLRRRGGGRLRILARDGRVERELDLVMESEAGPEPTAS